ncbi:MAG: hypothetical protein ACK4ZS_03610 [Sulfurimicrobium sp.]
MLHAHAHGLSMASGVHLDGVEQLLVKDSGATAVMAERGDVPAITMAREYRRDSIMAVLDAAQPVLATPIFSFPTAFFHLPLAAVIVITPSGRPLNYSRPFPQAPPFA